MHYWPWKKNFFISMDRCRCTRHAIIRVELSLEDYFKHDTSCWYRGQGTMTLQVIDRVQQVHLHVTWVVEQVQPWYVGSRTHRIEGAGGIDLTYICRYSWHANFWDTTSTVGCNLRSQTALTAVHSVKDIGDSDSTYEEALDMQLLDYDKYHQI